MCMYVAVLDCYVGHGARGEFNDGVYMHHQRYGTYVCAGKSSLICKYRDHSSNCSNMV